MAKFIFKLPDIGEGIAEAEIAEWKVKVGDVVTEDQPLVDMLTEKAAVEIPSPVDGKIVAIHGEPGEMVAIGFGFVEIETDADAAAEALRGEAEPAHEERISGGAGSRVLLVGAEDEGAPLASDCFDPVGPAAAEDAVH